MRIVITTNNPAQLIGQAAWWLRTCCNPLETNDDVRSLPERGHIEETTITFTNLTMRQFLALEDAATRLRLDYDSNQVRID